MAENNETEFRDFKSLVEYLTNENILVAYNQAINKTEFLKTRNCVYGKTKESLEDCDDLSTIIHYFGQLKLNLKEEKNRVRNKQGNLTALERTLLTSQGAASNDAFDQDAYEKEIKEIIDIATTSYNSMEDFTSVYGTGSTFGNLEKGIDREEQHYGGTAQIPPASIPIKLHDSDFVDLYRRADPTNQIYLICAKRFKQGFAITYIENKPYDADIFEKNIERCKELLTWISLQPNLNLMKCNVPKLYYKETMEIQINYARNNNLQLTPEMTQYMTKKEESKVELEKYVHTENAFHILTDDDWKELLKTETFKEKWDLICANFSVFEVSYSDNNKAFNKARMTIVRNCRWGYAGLYLDNALERSDSSRKLPAYIIATLGNQVKKTTVGSFLQYYQSIENSSGIHTTLFEYKLDTMPQGFRNNLIERSNGINLISWFVLAFTCITDIDLKMFSRVDLALIKWLLLMRTYGIKYSLFQLHPHYPFKDKMTNVLSKLAYYVMLAMTNNNLTKFNDIREKLAKMIPGTKKFGFSNQINKRLGSAKSRLQLDNGQEFKYGEQLIDDLDFLQLVRATIFNPHNWSVKSYANLLQFMTESEARDLLERLGLNPSGIEERNNKRPSVLEPKTKEMIARANMTHNYITETPDVRNLNMVLERIERIELDLNKTLETYNASNGPNSENLVEREPLLDNETARRSNEGNPDAEIKLKANCIQYVNYYGTNEDDETGGSGGEEEEEEVVVEDEGSAQSESEDNGDFEY